MLLRTKTNSQTLEARESASRRRTGESLEREGGQTLLAPCSYSAYSLVLYS